MSNLTMTQNFVIQNPDGWEWTISSFDGYVTIALTDETGDGKTEPLVITMTKEEAYHVANAIKALTQ